MSNGPGYLWKLIRVPKYLTWGTNSTTVGHLEQFLALKMAISHKENWLKNRKKFEKRQNPIQKPNFGALCVLEGVLGYADVFPNVC